MQYVLCDSVTYSKEYAREHYKYVRIYDVKDLNGFKGCTVRVHEFDALDDEQSTLQKQLEALAEFDAIRLVYIDEDGIENKYFRSASV